MTDVVCFPEDPLSIEIGSCAWASGLELGSGKKVKLQPCVLLGSSSELPHGFVPAKNCPARSVFTPSGFSF